MKKSVSISVIVATIIVGLVIVGVTAFEPPDSENPPSNQNEPSAKTTVPEPKNHVLELQDGVSTASP